MQKPAKRWWRTLLWVAGGLMAVAAVAVGLLIAFGRPKVSVAAGGGSLFHLDVSGLGASVSSVRVTGGGHAVATRSSSGGYVPASPVPQGEKVVVTAQVQAPSWLGWLVGSGASSTRTLVAPVSRPAARVALSSTPGRVQVAFTTPVSSVRYTETGGSTRTVRVQPPAATVDLAVAKQPAGSLTLAATPHSWELTPAQPSRLTWFVPPSDGSPAALVDPAPGSSSAGSAQPVSITFDQPVSQVLGSSRPKITPSVPGSWSQPNPDTLVFSPSGFGFGPGASVTVAFGRSVAAVGATSSKSADATQMSATDSYTFDVAAGSVLRLEQILADLHYLPLTFTPAAGAARPTTMAGEVAAMTQPPAGTFSWTWANTPATLQSTWKQGASNEMLKGALMAFDAVRNSYDGYKAEAASVSQLADASLWQALLQADLAHQDDPRPYSYVYVTKSQPETLTLWQNGSVVLTSAANTGIAQDPTVDGTFPVYIRFTQNWMSGTNPDGSKYHDLVNWISYFNGSDAVHAFPRASYGFPQSLGCVELPAAAGHTAFEDMAIGDLVTVAG